MCLLKSFQLFFKLDPLKMYCVDMANVWRSEELGTRDKTQIVSVSVVGLHYHAQLFILVLRISTSCCA